MKKLISFSLFVCILLMMTALHSAQAQTVIVRSGPIVGRGFYRPAYTYPVYRYGARIRPVPAAYYARPRFYRGPRVGVRVRVW